MPDNKDYQRDLDEHFAKVIQCADGLVKSVEGKYTQEEIDAMSLDEWFDKILRPISRMARGE